MNSPNHTDDTIAAVITPPGEGGIAALRLAGSRSVDILDQLFHSKQDVPSAPFVMRLGTLCDREGGTLDEVMAVHMPAGRSYTGLEQVEIFCHGGRLIVRRILHEILACGARAAEPGEFTKLAFLNGRIDLSRAEAVAEIIAANSDRSLQASTEHLLGAYSEHLDTLRERLLDVLADLEAAIDMSDEDIRPNECDQLVAALGKVRANITALLATYKGGRIIKEGFRLAIAGRPNAGKSSLFNRLLKQERALVNPEPGTTRDYLSEWIDLDGFAVNLIDTAGLRAGGGEVERMGQARSQELMEKSDLLLWLADVSEMDWESNVKADLAKAAKPQVLVVANKTDLAENVDIPAQIDSREVVNISCKTGAGLDELRAAIVTHINVAMPDLTSGLVVTSERHQEKLRQAEQAVGKTIEALADRESPEITSFELRQGVDALAEITGRIYTEDVLGRIFARFCVGK